MNTIKNLFLAATLMAALLAVFIAKPAKADTISDQIASTRAQITSLQSQLQQLLTLQNNPQSTWCYTFNRNIRIGESGADAAALQTALSKQSLYNYTTASAIFDEPLASAVVAFQERYATQILIPNGLTHGTGYVGTSTRAKLNALYGCNTNSNNIVISPISGPSTLGVNQTGTWTLTATNYNNSPLTYSVNWSDQPLYLSPMANAPMNMFGQTATFTHAYAAAGTYTVIFHVTDAAGNTATSTLSVVVTPQYAQALSVAVMDNFFSPRIITVQSGSTVTWTNMGTMSHTITADNGSFDSGTLNPGTSFNQTFNHSGTFYYYCRFHGGPGGSGMSGIIIVQ